MVPRKEVMRATTMTTFSDVICQRRLRLLGLPDEIDNITGACRQKDVKGTHYYQGSKIAVHYAA
jgi:hypothetical protein|tara:strand:- start:682 stop:873 length:192 start_codon:yes stop_codon:yes gene_type:complete